VELATENFAASMNRPCNLTSGLAARLLVCLAALYGVLVSCAKQEPDRLATYLPVPGRHSVFVLGHGYHSGLVVRAREVPEGAWPARRDFPNAEYLELGWGEREYYQHDDPGPGLALRALFTSSPSTLKVVAITGPLTRFFPESELVELHVSPEGFERMIDFVRRTHEVDAAGRAIMLRVKEHEGSRFYASAGTFHVLENCNVWVARALQAAGFPVDPTAATTTGMLLRQVRPLSIAMPAAR
jgi:uncharacterized protein (TIGR02117 family)